MTDNQLLHKVNGIRRIKQAIKNCDLPITERGTMFSSNQGINQYEFRKIIDGLIEIELNKDHLYY